jgi:ribosomal protein S18 acetylase RimI-like enzyme
VGAFAGEQLMGTAGFVRDKGLKERHKGHIWGVYVTRAARRNGRDMLRVLLDRASGVAGVEQIILAVAATQHAAMSLYRSLGFAPFGCEPRALKIGDRYMDEENMIFYVNRPHLSRIG